MHHVRRPFQFPEPLGRALCDRFWNGTEPRTAELAPFARSLQTLWKELAQGRGQAPAARHYSMRRDQTEAYAAYYLPANALKLPLVLEEARRFGLLGGAMPMGSPWRWLDVGSGPGTAFWGLAWWARARGVDVAFTGLERSAEFVQLAGELSRALVSRLSAEGGPAARATASWEALRRGVDPRALGERIAGAKPHVVSLMNSVGEIEPSVEKRFALLDAALDGLAELAAADSEGVPRWLIVIEPGSRAASRELLEARERLRTRADARIWLPCLDQRPCGALAAREDWCHEEAEMRFPQWMDRLGESAGLRKEAAVFSYLVVSVGRHPIPEAHWPGSEPAGGVRVVSQLMREKGMTVCHVCASSGKTRARLLDSRANDETAGFARSVRGQVYRELRLGEKGDVVGYAESGVDVEADPTVFPPLR